MLGLLARVQPRETQEIVGQVPETTATAGELWFDGVARRTRRLISYSAAK